MVHALEQARQHLLSDGVLVLIQPHQLKRPFIAIAASRMKRQPVAALENPIFQPLINAAVEAIQTVVDERQFVRIGTSHHQFRVRLASPAELDRYLHLGQRPPRFPLGGRQRLRDLWASRPAGARIEVTEFLTVIGLRAASS
jgi:hypothetical protein